MQQLWSEPTTVQRQIFIELPIEEMFAYLAALENLPKWDTWLSQVAFDGETLQGVYSLDVAGVPFPLSFPVTHRVTELRKPAALTITVTGAVQAVLYWSLQQQAQGTLVSFRIDYQMSHEVIGEAQASFARILSANAANVEQALANIKMLAVSTFTQKQPIVLIVEDNKSIQELLAMFLMVMGKYTIIPAASGAEAIEKIALLRPDLLLLDYHLPDMTGLQLYDYLYARGDHSALSILIMSAGLRHNPDLSTELEKRGLPALPKPFHLKELQEAMARVLSPALLKHM